MNTVYDYPWTLLPLPQSQLRSPEPQHMLCHKPITQSMISDLKHMHISTSYVANNALDVVIYKLSK